MQAIWEGKVVADSDATIVIEGNHYFPAAAVDFGCLRRSSTHTTCPWKGEASYFDVVIGDAVNADAAWTYPSPKEAAAQIAGYIAFWKGVEVR